MVQIQLDIPDETHLLLMIQAKKRKTSLKEICLELLSKGAKEDDQKD